VGSTRVTTDETGAVYNNCNWWPFGDQQSCTAGPATDIGYAGYEHDQQTGLDHTWFRYYNPRLGRWMGADPLAGDILNPQLLNRYAYVRNSPPNLIDLFGLDGCPPGQRFNLRTGQCEQPTEGGTDEPASGGGDRFRNPTTEPAGWVSLDGNWHCFNGGACVYTGGSAGGGVPCLTGAEPLLPGQSRCADAAKNQQPPSVPKPPDPVKRYADCSNQIHKQAANDRMALTLVQQTSFSPIEASCLLAGLEHQNALELSV